jgi:hypothetical protein
MTAESLSPGQDIEFYQAAAHKRLEDLRRLSRDFLVAEVVERHFDQELEELSRHFYGSDEDLAVELADVGEKIDECVKQLSRLRDV